MSTDNTAPAEPLWARIKRAVSYVLHLEPVAVAAVWRAIIVLAAAARVAGTIVSVYALIELLTTLRARALSVPLVATVEHVVEGAVVAGPANELATGTVVRAEGSLTGGLYPSA